MERSQRHRHPHRHVNRVGSINSNAIKHPPRPVTTNNTVFAGEATRCQTLHHIITCWKLPGPHQRFMHRTKKFLTGLRPQDYVSPLATQKPPIRKEVETPEEITQGGGVTTWDGALTSDCWHWYPPPIHHVSSRTMVQGKTQATNHFCFSLDAAPLDSCRKNYLSLQSMPFEVMISWTMSCQRREGSRQGHMKVISHHLCELCWDNAQWQQMHQALSQCPNLEGYSWLRLHGRLATRKDMFTMC